MNNNLNLSNVIFETIRLHIEFNNGSEDSIRILMYINLVKLGRTFYCYLIFNHLQSKFIFNSLDSFTS